MERQRAVAGFWNWLPGFRAVAETEHLPTAGARAHLTPAALSRTVRLLEDEIGHPLFMRRGRRLHLNTDGETLLRAVRSAMRIVHDAQQSISGERFTGRVVVAAGGVGQVYAARAVLEARRQYPGMRPWLITPDPSKVVEQLLSGELDVAVGSFVLRAPGLKTELLTYATSSVYCGPQHPLFHREAIDLHEIVQHPFTAPPPGPTGFSNDGWPPELDRDVRMVVDRIATGRDVCANTELLAVLPDDFAARSSIPLRALPQPPIPKTPVVAIHRDPTGADDLTARLLDLLRQGPD